MALLGIFGHVIFIEELSNLDITKEKSNAQTERRIFRFLV